MDYFYSRIVRMTWARTAFLGLGMFFIVTMAVLPVFVSKPASLTVTARSQTAQVDYGWEPDQGGDIYYDADGGYGTVVDYGGCAYGDCYADGAYGYQTDAWGSYYGSATGGYISSGLSQVPLILTGSLTGQSQSGYSSYTSYVPQQQTYTQMQQQAQTVQQGPDAYYVESRSTPSTPDAPVVVQPVTPPAPPRPQVQVAPAPVVLPSGQQTAYLFVPAPAPERVVLTQAPSEKPAGPTLPTCSIKASLTRLALGATTTLTWVGTGADTAAVDPLGSVSSTGSTTVPVATTTTYVLTVKNSAGTRSCSVKVTIDPTMCTSVCPPGFVCTPIPGGTQTPRTTSGETTQKKGFWSWLGL